MSDSGVLIDEKAHVSPKAQLGKNVKIGPFVVVEDECEIGDDTTIHSHAVIKNHVKIGARCFIGNSVVVGADPQIFGLEKKKSFVHIKDGVTLREFVTIHRSNIDHQSTIVGEGCLLMVGVHLGHDVVLGKEVIVTNFAQLGGHVCVDDNAFISSGCLFHQHAHVGRLSMTSTRSRITKNVLPFSIVGGDSDFYGINAVGLKRQAISAEEREKIRQYFKYCQKEGLEKIKSQQKKLHPLEQEIFDFIKNSQRGLILYPTKK